MTANINNLLDDCRSPVLAGNTECTREDPDNGNQVMVRIATPSPSRGTETSSPVRTMSEASSDPVRRTARKTTDHGQRILDILGSALSHANYRPVINKAS